MALTRQQDSAIVTLDPEKGFDEVNWPLLFSILKRFKFGDSFIN